MEGGIEVMTLNHLLIHLHFEAVRELLLRMGPESGSSGPNISKLQFFLSIMLIEWHS